MSQDTMINERVDEGEGEEGDRKRPEILSQRDEVRTLDRKEADMAHRQMEVYKGKWEPHVRMRRLILIVKQMNQRGLLVTGLQRLASGRASDQIREQSSVASFKNVIYKLLAKMRELGRWTIPHDLVSGLVSLHNSISQLFSETQDTKECTQISHLG